MGTRNLTIVRLDNKTRVAQYGQWDGYLHGAGSTVFDTLTYPGSVEQLRKAVQNVSWISDEEYLEAKESVGIDPEAVFVTWDEGKKFEARYPELGRDIGAGILQHIIDHPYGVKVDNAESFASSPDCEYAYVVDLDRNVLEVYDRYIIRDGIIDENQVLPKDSGMKLIGVYDLDEQMDDFKELILSEEFL